jgi:predicted O-methyltransferase YrrM
MKEAAKKFIRRIGKLWHESLTSGREPTVLEILNERARQDSADFLASRLDHAVLFRSVSKIRTFAFRDINPDGLILEFGVYTGSSTRLFAKSLTDRNDSRTVFGFDSFEGLEEDWSGQVGVHKTTFSTGGKLPDVPDNVQLIKGWVQETLQDFLDAHPDEPISFIHCDMDTYTPTKFALEAVKDRCVHGTVILFDELYGYPNWRRHEYRALMEVFGEDEFEYFAFSDLQAAIRIK